MTVDRLLRELRGLDPPLTAEEIQDALWLAQHFGRVRRGTEASEPRPSRAGPPPSPEAPRPSPAEPRDPDPPTEPAGSPQPRREVGLYLAEDLGTAADGVVHAPAPNAIPGVLRLTRALRPLRVRVDSKTDHRLDEEGTAQQIAETGIWRPLMRPLPERRFDLTLVVDGNTSMLVWQQTAKELRALLERLGAFRDVRCWQLDTGRRGTLSLFPVGGSEHHPGEIIDPTRRRIILVFSDCIGAAWQDGRMADLLDRWGRNGPVAVVQPLPERLWRRCGIVVEPVRITGFEPGAANSKLRVEMQSASAKRPPGVAVPVMELSPRWLTPWASLIAEGSRRGIFGSALFTGRLADQTRPPAEPTDLTPLDRVMRFRASASPDAYRLAVHLSAAPLRLPVMRLVQQAMLPDSTLADLAEIQLSELLKPVDPPAGSHAYHVAYSFHDGVRTILMSGLRRGETLRVLRNVWNVVRDNFGSSLDFPALLKEIERDGSGLPPDQLFAQVAAEVLGRLGGRYSRIARNIIVAGPEDRADGPRPGGRLWGPLPPRKQDFVGREALLRSMRESLAENVTALLPRPMPGLGLGGEGKSQLALEYAYRFEEEYDLICWIPADQLTMVRATLAALARELSVLQSDSIHGLADNLRHFLQTNGNRAKWLFILDNAHDPQELRSLLPPPPSGEEPPPPSWDVLVTSRDRRWEEWAHVIDVGVFQRSESIAYLMRRAPQLSEAEADQLAERVGDLPLSIEQAAAWQTGADHTVGEYLELFDRRLRSSPDQLMPDRVPDRLAVSIGLGLERLDEENPLIRRLFALWAFFSPEPVAARLLLPARDTAVLAPLSGLISDEETLLSAMRTIDRFELARFDPEGRTLQVHRLVRAVLEARIPPQDRPAVRGQVHAVLVAATPSAKANDETTWARRSLITPHVLASGLIDAVDPEARRVALDQAQYLALAGDFGGSRLLAESARNRWLEAYGPDDDFVLEASRMLANALRALGDTRSAAELNKDTLERAERKYEPDNLTTLFTALGYGADLKYLGRFDEAHRLDQQTWLRMGERFGRDNAENTLIAAGNVSLSLRLLGRFHEAYNIDKSALESLRSRRDIFRGTHHLARDLHGLGRYTEALTMQRESLDRIAPALSADHALVLQAQMSHAGTLREAGLHDEAERLADDVFQSHVRGFGDRHPNTLAAQVCLAMSRLRTGRLQEARELQQGAWSRLKQVLGEQHPFVHSCAGGLAMILRAGEDIRAAQAIDEAALDGLRTGPVPEHYYTLFLSAGLSIDLYLLGELEEARQRSAETLRRMAAFLGENHPVTLSCAHNHLLVCRAAGVPADFAQDPLAGLERLLGAHHPSVQTARRGEPLDCIIDPVPL